MVISNLERCICFSWVKEIILERFLRNKFIVLHTTMLPDFIVRFMCFLLAHLCYRIKVEGIENVPSEKSALLICNHVSWVDALLINATQQRRVRFVMVRKYYNKKWLKPLCKLMGVIPIASSDSPKKMIASLKDVRQAMDEDFLVCIFAEGAITRTGMLRSFRAGFEKIVRGTDYDIIPAYIGGAWGSIFSYYYGKPLSTLPKKFPYPVSIHFGSAMDAGSSAVQIREKVTELSYEYFNSLKERQKSLADHFVRTARKNWSR